MAKLKKNSSYLDDMQEESSYQRYIKSRKKSNSKIGIFLTITAIAICLGLVAVISITMFNRQENQPDATIKNVTVDDICLKGLTTQEAVVLLNKHAEELLPQDEILIKLLDEILVLTNADTKAQLDTSAMATAAYLHGRNNKSTGEEPLNLDPYDFVKLDASSVRPILKNFVQAFNGRPTETTISISGERPDLTTEPLDGEPNQVLTITIGTPKYLCDPESLFRTILSAHKTRKLKIEGEVLLIEPKKVTAVGIFSEYCVNAVNASIDPDTHIVTKSVYGYGFDTWQLQQKLNAAQWGEVIIIPLSRIKPSVTTDELNNNPF